MPLVLGKSPHFQCPPGITPRQAAAWAGICQAGAGKEGPQAGASGFRWSMHPSNPELGGRTDAAESRKSTHWAQTQRWAHSRTLSRFILAPTHRGQHSPISQRKTQRCQEMQCNQGPGAAPSASTPLTALYPVSRSYSYASQRRSQGGRAGRGGTQRAGAGASQTLPDRGVTGADAAAVGRARGVCPRTEDLHTMRNHMQE